MVPVGGQEPHQLSRTPGSYVCSEVICQGQEGQPHSSQNGRQNRSILCQPHGGDTISCAEQACNPTVAMVSREKHMEASQLLEVGWSKGTNTTYQSAWKRWHGWCSRQEINPISCTVQPFLEFLTSLFKEGLHYRIINTIRSAISMTHDHMKEYLWANTC